VFAHATQFVILPAVAGFLVLDLALVSRRTSLLFAAGSLLGMSVLMKQHAALFVAFALAIVLWRDLRVERVPFVAALRRAAALAAGAAAPFALLCAALAAQGVLGRFWFWTVHYARDYVSEVPLSGALPALVAGVRTITLAAWPLWLVAVLGLACLWLAPWRRGTRVFVVGFLVTSFLTTCPGFYFRDHYFIAMLPAVALLAGVAIASLARLAAHLVRERVATALAALVWLAALLAWAIPERGYLFAMSPDDVSRARYGRNLFAEAPAIGRYVREHTAATDRIAVIGSEPEIYFYAGRRSATGYIYTYPLMEQQPLAAHMQDEMIREIEGAHPAMIVFVASRTSWAPSPGADRHVLVWADRYLHRCYDVVGIAERLPDGSTAMRWGADAVAYRPRTENVVYTLTRRSDAPCSAPEPAAR